MDETSSRPNNMNGNGMQQSSSLPSTSSTMSIKLIVKPSYQPFNDIEIECQEDWTILKIKQHIAEVYPFKPDVNQQKLIYSGKLLTDNNIILKDILQSTTNIFHLVYNMPKKIQVTPHNNLNDGLRHRNVQETITEIPQVVNNSAVNSNTIPNTMTTGASNITNNNCPLNNSNSVGNFAYPGIGNIQNGQITHEMIAQQVAMQNWVHQVYLQYMNQCMNFRPTIGTQSGTAYFPNSMPAINSGGNAWVGLPQMPLIRQNVPQFGNFNLGGNINLNDNNANTTPGVTGPTIINAPETRNVPVIGAMPQNAAPPAAAVAAAAAVVEQERQRVERRFPNIVQEEQENRDWLDMFYSLSRVMVLITLVYLYSSPLRLFVAITIGLTIYLYHIGFLRTQRPPEANNNIINNNLNREQQPAPVQPEANNDGDARAPNNGVDQINDVQAGVNTPNTPGAQNQVRDGEQSVAAAVAAVRGEDATHLVPEVENNRTSVMAFVKTFVVSFFTSLLPETPAL